MDSLELQDIARVSLAAGRQRYRAAVAQALHALAELPEIAHAIRHSAATLGDEAVLTCERFFAAQDSHLFAAAYDWRLASADAARRADAPAKERLTPISNENTNPKNAHHGH